MLRFKELCSPGDPKKVKIRNCFFRNGGGNYPSFLLLKNTFMQNLEKIHPHILKNKKNS